MYDGIRLVVGTYARRGGTGLASLTLHGDTMHVGEPAGSVPDASFGIWSSRWERFYLAVEQTEGQLATCDANLCSAAEAAATKGAAPCHLALDPEQRLLAVANYESGSVALFQIGSSAARPILMAHRRLVGHGRDPERQAGPHAHWVGFGGGGQWLHVVDLGADRILRLPVDADQAAFGEPEIAYAAPAGTGPRHLAFHPVEPRAFLVSELASTLTILDVNGDGTLSAVQTLSTVPDGISGSLGGAIAINAAADRLYVTNRGHDSIAVFAIKASGAALIEHVPSGGASPRFLLLLEAEWRLLVANEEGGTVCQFGIADDGCLTRIGEAAGIPGAVFVARLPARPRALPQM